MASWTEWVPWIHLIATASMAGVILFVQIVHYPLMAWVSESAFVRYERAHTARTGIVVVPLMVTELGSALWLAAIPPAPGMRTPALLGLILLAAIWLSTALIQVPAHRRLSDSWDPRVHGYLVQTNWIRTVGWVARVPVAAVLTWP